MKRLWQRLRGRVLIAKGHRWRSVQHQEALGRAAVEGWSAGMADGTERRRAHPDLGHGAWPGDPAEPDGEDPDCE